MNLLYVAKLYPYPPDDGGNVRVFNILRQLCARYTVTLVTQVPAKAQPIPLPITIVSAAPRPWWYQKLLPVLNIFRLIPYHQQLYLTKDLIDKVHNVCQRMAFGQVIVDSLYLSPLVRSLPGQRVIVNEQNYEPQVMKDRYRAARNPLLKAYFYWQYLKVYRLKRWAVRRTDLSFFCVSQQDADQVQHLNQWADVSVVPNGVDPETFIYAPPPRNEVICFLGSLAWAPNVDGISWFLKDVWPRLKAMHPGVTFKVVGQDPNNIASQYRMTDVEFTGRVEDVIPHVRSTAVFVVPLRFGGGTKLKLLEAMALGRPVVTTTKGAEGIDGIMDGNNLLIADDPARFAQAIDLLLNAPEDAAKIGRAAHELVVDTYSWTEIGQHMDVFITASLRRAAVDSRWLHGHNIICFSNDWHQDPLSKHHLMSVLAGGNKILWVNSIGMRTPTATTPDIKKMATKAISFVRGLERVRRTIWVGAPLVIPYHGSTFISRINKWFLSAQVRHWQKKLGLNQPIIWSFLPNTVGTIGSFGERLTIYYITDDFTCFTGHPSTAIAFMEAEMLRHCDLAFASAKQLLSKGEKIGKEIHLIQHGVDYQHFAAALKITPGQFPNDIKNLKRPVIGFYGEINDWIDTDMLATLAELRPDWSLVLVGRIAAEAGNLDHLLKLPNVHWLGQKRYQELPAYCAAFDVALIPMKMNELTRSVNPLKLREYLAAGVPVVSAPLPEVLPYGDVVKFATTADEYTEAIDELLKLDRKVLSFRLSARVEGEGWDMKVVEISQIIEKALANK